MKNLLHAISPTPVLLSHHWGLKDRAWSSLQFSDAFQLTAVTKSAYFSYRSLPVVPNQSGRSPPNSLISRDELGGFLVFCTTPETVGGKILRSSWNTPPYSTIPHNMPHCCPILLYDVNINWITCSVSAWLDARNRCSVIGWLDKCMEKWSENECKCSNMSCLLSLQRQCVKEMMSCVMTCSESVSLPWRSYTNGLLSRRTLCTSQYMTDDPVYGWCFE